MPTIKEIAVKCNVSNATVSKALHNSSELKQETIDYICKTAKKMGYIPNAIARSLKNNRTHSIGILYVDHTSWGLKHEYFSTILDSIKVEAESKGYDVTFISHNYGGETISYLEHTRYRRLDGVVIVSVDFTDKEVQELVNSEIPCVTIDYVYNSATAVLSNNASGLESLTDYIIDSGHKKIAFIHGENTEVTKKRLAGFYHSMSKHNIEVDESLLFTGAYHDPKSSGKITKELLASENIPSCIIYPDDVSMIGGISAITNAGYKVPEDISCAGFDGVNISRIMRPIFTTFVQAADELGKVSANELIGRIEHKEMFVPKVIVVDGEVQTGGTVKVVSSK